MKTFLVVGSNFSGLKHALKTHGYNYITLRDVLKAKDPHVKKPRRIVCDFSSKHAILKTIDSITEPIDAVITVYENYVRPAAWIAERLNVPGLPPEAAEACTDKEIMRARFAESPEPISPDFAVIYDEQSLIDFANSHGFPLIIKPANLAKSLLVSRSNTLDELLINYRNAIKQIETIYRKYAPNRTPKLLVEEFLQGSIHSVDAFIDQSGVPHVLENVVDYLTGYDIGYDDNFHYARLLPSSLNHDVQQAIRHTAQLGCRALGMKSSPAHVEIILTPQGPRIVEIGARNGGYRERMHRISNDIDIQRAAFDIVLGKVPTIKSRSNYPSAVLELFPQKPGTFVGIENEKELKKLPSLQHFAIKQPLGDYVGSSSDGYKMCALVILNNKDLAQYEKDLAYVNEHVFVVTR